MSIRRAMWCVVLGVMICSPVLADDPHVIGVCAGVEWLDDVDLDVRAFYVDDLGLPSVVEDMNQVEVNCDIITVLFSTYDDPGCRRPTDFECAVIFAKCP